MDADRVFRVSPSEGGKRSVATIARMYFPDGTEELGVFTNLVEV